MGSDFLIYSKENPQLFKENDPNQYLNWALHDIDFYSVFKLLHINLSENCLGYWCPEQVEHMYEMIKLLNEDPHKGLYDGWTKEELEDHMIEDINEAIKLKDDIKKLCDYFNFLVKNKAYIRII